MKKIIKKHFGLAKELIEIGAGQNMFVRCYPLLGEVPLVIDRKQDTKVEIPKTKKLALFVYVPFCTGKCSYCFYPKKINPDQNEIEEYLVLLEKEMDLLMKSFKFKKIHALYIGGGTPSYLSPKQIEKLIKTIKNFPIEEDASFTFEVSPETLTSEKIEVLLANKVKRISMGVQSLNDKTLFFARRRYSARDAYEKIFLLKEKSNFNLDFIFGLKNQPLKDDVFNWLKLIQEIKPPAVTFYEKWEGMRDRLEIKSRKPKLERIAKLLSVRELIDRRMRQQLGYKRDGLYRYILCPDGKCNYCKTVWEDNFCLALGPSSYGYFNGMIYRNTSRLNLYRDLLRKNFLPVERKKVLSKKEKIIRALVLGLKTTGTKGVSVSREIEYLIEPLIPLIKKGFLNKIGSKVSFSEKGLLASDRISNWIIDNLELE